MANTTMWLGSDKYLCDPELAQSFHMARVLGMPLLIEGEPGTGKTELPIQFSNDLNLDLFVYPVGSKSTVEAFVAKFDHVKYLRDSQIEVLNAQREEKGLEKKLSTGGRSTEKLDDYILMGPAAKGYTHPHSVLLIDEIDKAPREFPNDLLYALSHRKFVMPESGKEISVSEEEMPAIVITSNREQELPTAFKGRCIYHYITFPTPELMREIVDKHFPEIEDELISKALQLFYHFRNLGLERSPSTRELLNWLKYLNTFEINLAIQKIENREGLGVLVKTKEDLQKIKLNGRY
ncbi:MAG: MoxR family ATPase [Bacteroidetes bacterium]|jgi:MoxR-like ATPase|nr:MoxR family ATPase [Bacteroidota bacterium]MDF1868585.1 MoxR family ATPase [Saprospiraceae bacterium]